MKISGVCVYVNKTGRGRLVFLWIVHKSKSLYLPVMAASKQWKAYTGSLYQMNYTDAVEGAFFSALLLWQEAETSYWYGCWGWGSKNFQLELEILFPFGAFYSFPLFLPSTLLLAVKYLSVHSRGRAVWVSFGLVFCLVYHRPFVITLQPPSGVHYCKQLKFKKHLQLF